MSRKAPQKTTQLQKIPELINGQSDIKQSTDFNKKRISIATLMNNLHKVEKVAQTEHKESQLPESKVEEKDRMIKELQQEILDKKLRNDMIQQAFHKRNQTEQLQTSYSRSVEILAEGCKLLTAQNLSFKKTYLRSLLTILKNSGKNKQKAVKSLLIWMISWITRLFTFLSSTLIKK